MPRGMNYMLVVDCKEGHCEAVKAHMRSLGYTVRKNDTSLGDHYGIKHFSSDRKAGDAAQEVYDSCPGQIYQVAILPEK